MSRNKKKPYFHNGVPELLILKLLSEKEMYGYELVRAIEHVSDHSFSFGEGCIYPLLHNLEKRRHLDCRPEDVSGRTRYYYKANKRGVRHLKQLTDEWMNTVKGIGKVFEFDHG